MSSHAEVLSDLRDTPGCKLYFYAFLLLRSYEVKVSLSSIARVTELLPSVVASRYHLNDVIYGSISFLTVGTEITNVSLQIVRRETTAQQGRHVVVCFCDHAV
jgi:hypothetical protein